MPKHTLNSLFPNTFKHFVLLISACMGFAANATESAELQANPKIEIAKTSHGEWTVTYRSASPIDKLVFMRNPDTSRTQRWHAQNPNLAFKVDDQGQEFIATQDGSAFTEARFTLTPTYQHLPKDYAPFAPFSDGGSLTHSGRYFACADTCENVANEWHFTVVAPEQEHIVVNGALHQSQVSWVDNDSGRNLYIGGQKPVQGEAFIAVVDEKLPSILKDALSDQLPKLMQFFAAKLGDVKGPTPMLFASYSNKPGSSSQGGTLPDQIFMHWDFDDLGERVKSQQYVYQTLWFFAHEAAHFFQKSVNGEPLYGEPEHAWIHEGGAEWLAQLALTELYPEMHEYIAEKETLHQTQCQQGLEQTSMVNAAQEGQFRLYYSCGYFVHQALANSLSSESNVKLDTYAMWKAYASTPKDPDLTAVEHFWFAIEQLAPQSQLNEIKHVLSNDDATVADFWASLNE